MKRTELEWALSVAFPINVNLPSLLCAIPIFAVLILYIFIIKKITLYLQLKTISHLLAISEIFHSSFTIVWLLVDKVNHLSQKIETQE